jgi:hypothetical protein
MARTFAAATLSAALALGATGLSQAQSGGQEPSEATQYASITQLMSQAPKKKPSLFRRLLNMLPSFSEKEDPKAKPLTEQFVKPLPGGTPTGTYRSVSP